MKLSVVDMGTASYASALELQKRLLAEVQAAPQERSYLVLVEHDPPVITLGRRAKDEHVLASPERMKQEGIELHHVARGGDVTYHGPGQLVGYPIMHLDPRHRSVHRYMRDLEEVLIRLLGRFAVLGTRVPGATGVWVGQKKIAAIGVAVSRWVTWHGFALNVNANMAHFELIVPCGLAGKGVASLSDVLGRPVVIADVKPPLLECVRDVLGLEMELSEKPRIP